MRCERIPGFRVKEALGCVFCMKQKLGKARNLALPRLENPIQSYKYKATAAAAAGDKLSRPSVRPSSTARNDLDANPRLFVCGSFEKLGHAPEGGNRHRAPCYVPGLIQRSFYWIFSVKSSAKQKLYSSLVRSEREGSSLFDLLARFFAVPRWFARPRYLHILSICRRKERGRGVMNTSFNVSLSFCRH